MPIPSLARIVLTIGLLVGAQPAIAQQRVVRLVPETEPTLLDPVASVLAVTQQHAYMIYDTLFALDAAGVPRPQMVGEHSTDASGRMHTMTLRAGLRFHDGTPVRAADAVASIRRWALRDVVGGQLRQMGLRLTVVDDRSFTVETDQPTPLVLEGFAKPASIALFVMREADAAAEPTRAVTTHIGSGPFRFVAAEHRSGDRLVYERNPDYVPRDEPASYFAGGKRVRCGRVEFRILPDPATAAAALRTGEVDILDAPPLDLLHLLRRQRGIATRALDRGGIMGIMRPNHLHPPFDNVAARQALLAAINQRETTPVVGGDDPANWRECFSFLSCGGPQPTEAGMDDFRRPDPARARRLLAEAGYQGQPVVLMHPSEHPVLGPLTEVAAQNLRQAGFTVDLQTVDWATLVQRRASQAPPSVGGWNLFLTWAFDFDLRSPATNFLLASPCGGGGWFGWPCDREMDPLRDAWARETDPERRRGLLERIQARAAETAPLSRGQYLKQVAYRDTVQDLLDVPITVFWNLRTR